MNKILELDDNMEMTRDSSNMWCLESSDVSNRIYKNLIAQGSLIND